jgi:hypothetical protein
MLQEAGLGELLRPTVPPPSTKPVRFWKKIPLAVYAVLGASALLITLLEGYPWLTIQETGALNPTDPYSEMFTIRNSGYWPLINLNADCAYSFNISFAKVSDAHAMQQGFFADVLIHDKPVTIPCFENLQIKNLLISSGATLTIRIGYGFYPVSNAHFRTSQVFRFESALGENGAHHWKYLP